jgi:hypothetical protein
VGGAYSANGGEEERVWEIGRKTGGKGTLGRLRRKWLDNIKMDLLEIGYGAGAGLVWVRIGESGEPLLIR